MTGGPEITDPMTHAPDPRIVLRAMGLPALADDDEELPPLAYVCPECGAVQVTDPPCRECGSPMWPVDDDPLAVALLADAA